MSGRGGIYKGPYGDDLYGDGKEVETGTTTDPQVRQLAEQIAKHINDNLLYAMNPAVVVKLADLVDDIQDVQ